MVLYSFYVEREGGGGIIAGAPSRTHFLTHFPPRCPVCNWRLQSRRYCDIAPLKSLTPTPPASHQLFGGEERRKGGGWEISTSSWLGFSSTTDIDYAKRIRKWTFSERRLTKGNIYLYFNFYYKSKILLMKTLLGTPKAATTDISSCGNEQCVCVCVMCVCVCMVVWFYPLLSVTHTPHTHNLQGSCSISIHSRAYNEDIWKLNQIRVQP